MMASYFRPNLVETGIKMITKIAFTERSLELLTQRDLSRAEVSNFQLLLNEAKQQGEQRSNSAKETLQNMSVAELAMLQKAHSLADPIHVASLSEEGATNLLAQPDHSDSVDVNNDGIVEVGIAKNIVFPPVNAPKFVKEAWDEATAGMPKSDKMMLELRMHIAVYGINLDGVNKIALSPEQQWNSENIENLISQLRSNLEFEVNLEGWTDFNAMLKDFYDRFENSLSNAPFSVITGSLVIDEKNKAQHESSTSEKSSSSHSEQTKDLFSLVLDARLGIDREKLSEIEDKMTAIESDNTLSSEQKQALLQQLQQEKEQYLKEVRERMVENEKNKLTEQISANLLTALNEDLKKQQAKREF